MIKAMPIDWHENCLKNQLTFIRSKEKELLKLNNEIDRLKKSTKNYKQQIDRAKKLKKKTFDSDKFKAS